ncbi:MAG: phosphohistidine phosphatase SixA [Promethearchaeota archaeon]
MKVYLVQHGIAFSKETDPARHISPQGFEILRKIGEFAKSNLKLKLNTIFHSGKMRALQTAELYATFFSPAHGFKSAEGLKPLDDPGIWADKLEDIGDDIMIVGHLPHLQLLYERLVLGNLDQKELENTPRVVFQNGGIIVLEKYGEKKWVVDFEILPDSV